MKSGAHKKPPMPEFKDGQLDPDTGLIESDFVKMIRAKIIGDGDVPNWPPEGQVLTDADAIADMNDALTLLFMRNEGKPLPSKIPAAKSLAKIVRDLLGKSKWPEEPPKIPTRFRPDPALGLPNRMAAFRRYEIACAFNIMMRAFHVGSGAAGSDTDWPPQRP